MEGKNEVFACTLRLDQPAHDRVGMRMRMAENDVTGTDVRYRRGVCKIVIYHLGPLFEKAEDPIGDGPRSAQSGIIPWITRVREMDARTVTA